MTEQPLHEELQAKLGSATGASYYATTGTSMTHLEPGFVIVELRPGADVTDASGRLLPGMAAAVADASLGAAIYSLLPPTMVSQTVELRLDTLPGVAARTDCVVARGHAVHLGSTTGFSRGEIIDGAGNLRALASCHCVVRPAADGEYTPLHPAAEASPYLLEVPSSALRTEPEVTSPADLDGFLALELARRLRLSVEAVGERTAVTRFPPATDLTNMYGMVHGGAVALFCEVAIAVALHALLPAGTGFAVLDFALNFLRPVPADGPVVGEAEVIHGGRRFSVVRAQLRNPDGRIAAIASTTVFLESPGQSAPN